MSALRPQVGSAHAQFHLGYMLQWGKGPAAKNVPLAVDWYRKAADQGHANAQCNLGVCLYYGQVRARRPKTLAVCAKDKSHHSVHTAPIGSRLCDHTKLVPIWCRAPPPPLCLSSSSLCQGVAKDETLAAFWFTKSALQGHAKAQCNLGVCYKKGRGVPRDDAKALHFYTLSANQVQ